MQQLALFDTSVIVSSIKPGDWVKLRRKSTSAAYWKKGEIVQIQSVHPNTGCTRFWNERAETWGYLHPNDVYVVPPPLDSVSKSIAPDTELNCPHSGTDIVARVETDTELNCPHSEINSVSIAPPADTELTPDPVCPNSVSGPVATYQPKGTARGGKYFRFSYRAGEKMKHLHIPGGNTGSVLAQSRATEVMELAAAGVPSLEICDRIRAWSGKSI